MNDIQGGVVSEFEVCFCVEQIVVYIVLHFEGQRVKLPALTASATIHANRSCDFWCKA
jgi:hypothetical protein